MTLIPAGEPERFRRKANTGSPGKLSAEFVLTYCANGDIL